MARASAKARKADFEGAYVPWPAMEKVERMEPVQIICFEAEWCSLANTICFSCRGRSQARIMTRDILAEPK